MDRHQNSQPQQSRASELIFYVDPHAQDSTDQNGVPLVPLKARKVCLRDEMQYLLEHEPETRIGLNQWRKQTGMGANRYMPQQVPPQRHLIMRYHNLSLDRLLKLQMRKKFVSEESIRVLAKCVNQAALMNSNLSTTSNPDPITVDRSKFFERSPSKKLDIVHSFLNRAYTKADYDRASILKRIGVNTLKRGTASSIEERRLEICSKNREWMLLCITTFLWFSFASLTEVYSHDPPLSQSLKNRVAWVKKAAKLKASADPCQFHCELGHFLVCLDRILKKKQRVKSQVFVWRIHRVLSNTCIKCSYAIGERDDSRDDERPVLVRVGDGLLEVMAQGGFEQGETQSRHTLMSEEQQVYDYFAEKADEFKMAD